MLSSLRARVNEVLLHNADETSFSISDTIFHRGDTVVGRGRSWPVFALLRAAELAGATVINSSAAISFVYDKARMAVELRAAGIRTPDTWIGTPREISMQVPPAQLPLVIKPVFGDNGAGILLISSKEELSSLKPVPVLAQRYIANDGFDLKLYCISERVFAVRKPCSVDALRSRDSEASRIELVPLTTELAALARQCRLCFGLELFGVDCLLTPEGPLVIEVNEFPNYSAVPNASDLLADYVCDRASVRC